MIKNLNQYFANDLIQHIDPQKVEKYKITRAQQVTNATINKEVKLLKSILNRAVDWKKIEANPIAQVKLLKEAHHHLRYLEILIGELLESDVILFFDVEILVFSYLSLAFGLDCFGKFFGGADAFAFASALYAVVDPPFVVLAEYSHLILC